LEVLGEEVMMFWVNGLLTLTTQREIFKECGCSVVKGSVV